MANSDQISKNLEVWAIKRVNLAQANLVQGIRNDTPVKTGRARAGTESIAIVEKLGDVGIIRNDVPYIGWLEYGTDRTFEHAMFRNNIAKVGK